MKQALCLLIVLCSLGAAPVKIVGPEQVDPYKLVRLSADGGKDSGYIWDIFSHSCITKRDGKCYQHSSVPRHSKPWMRGIVVTEENSIRRDSEVELRDIPGYPSDYKAGSDGHIYSKFIGLKKRKSFLTDDGYLRLTVNCYGKQRSVSVHLLVLLAFHGEKPSNKHEARHLNNIRDDNRPENLCWATHQENMDDKKLYGTTTVGEDHALAKLTEEQVLFIRNNHNSLRGSKMKLARQFGVSHKTIRNVINGKIWKHV